MPRYHVKITGKDYAALADLVLKYKVNVARHTIEEVKRGYRVDAHATGSQISRLTKAGYKVDQYENADKEGKVRQKEVRKVTRKAVAVEELAIQTIDGYLNVVEVETALAAAANAPNTAFTKLITLPNKTWGNRVCKALKIGKGTGANRPAIYFLGGVHAREWGSPDILINFVQLLTKAYATNSGLTIGANQFTAAQIKKIVETKDTYVFPQCNPDGRHFSMTSDPMWRKNRRPAPAGHPQTSCIGVDINRNYDFLWNYPVYFDAASPIANSTNPCDYQVYIGPAPASEPETKNAVWMFDKFPNIRYFIDIHSYSEAILYNWGDDDNQSTTPAMNFQNAAFNGKRGIAADTKYREYIAAADKTATVNLANKMKSAIAGIRGRQYKVEQAMSLYPTAGTSDDYAFSRHILNASKAKVYSYTIEWGSPSNPTPFHPAYSEMQIIIREITSALFAFCLAAT